MSVRNIKIIVEYDGTNFYGWQKQPELKTIQGAIEEAIKKILQEDIKIIGAGRTDRGVHAEGQVANFFLNTEIDLNVLLYRLNKVLPEDIRIKTIAEVEKGFNSRYKTKLKLYRYTILNSKIDSPLNRLFSYYVPEKLDISKMKKAKKILIGKHDFSSFVTSGSYSNSYTKTIKNITIQKNGDFIHMNFKAKSFLKNMVRNIVRTLIEVGKGIISLENIKEILDAKDRRKIPKSAPAHGLCLMKIEY